MSKYKKATPVHDAGGGFIVEFLSDLQRITLNPYEIPYPIQEQFLGMIRNAAP